MKDLYAGKKSDLDSISLKDLQAYHHKNFKASDTLTTIASDISAAQAKEFAAKAFGNWNEVASYNLIYYHFFKARR